MIQVGVVDYLVHPRDQVLEFAMGLPNIKCHSATESIISVGEGAQEI